ncbi:MAG: SMP-30/gluconolactonase/LRE family protein, partial [Vicinamibacteria bacterium]
MSNLGFLRRPRPRTVFCALLALALGGAAALQAASTGFWVVATQADFLKGDADAVSIDTDGRVTIAPALELLGEVGTPAVWRIAAARGQAWAATGHDGKLWSFPGQGPPKVLFDAPELDLQAIAAGPQGSVLVGSAPDGKVYRVAADGTSTTLFDPEDKYIWAIAVAPDGTTYVGTGAKGKVYKVPAAGGAGTLFYDSGTEHVSALAFDAAGTLLVGTSTPGRVVRLDADGKAFVILEAGYQEVRSLRVAGGVTYATAAGPATGAPATSSPSPTADTSTAVTMSTEVTVIAGSDSSIVTTAPASSGGDSRASGPQKGAIYQIAADGDWTTVWESPDDVPYDVLVEPGGSLLVGTGAK